jgi:hypothetical protein
MSAKRPNRLKWIGAMLPDGRPARHLGSYGLEPRDYDADETATLDGDTIAIARRHPDLYTVIDQKPSKSQPEDRTATNESAPAPEPDTAAETVTEGEGE